MLAVHAVLAVVVIALAATTGVLGFVAYRRGAPPGRVLTQLLGLVQTLLVAQVGIGLLLVADGRRTRDDLHYAYGTLALAAVLAPWFYAPREGARRLLWFAGATLLAAALATRAYFTAG